MYKKIILFAQKYLAFLPFVILLSLEETDEQFPGLLGEYMDIISRDRKISSGALTT